MNKVFSIITGKSDGWNGWDIVTMHSNKITKIAFDNIPGVAKLLDSRSHFLKLDIFREPQLIRI